MKNRNRSNMLLVEILFAVLFFMLSATVIVNVFVASRNMTVRSGVASRAVQEAQNVAEAIYTTEDVDGLMENLGFHSAHGTWLLDRGDYSIFVSGETQSAGVGQIWKGSVSAFYNLRNPDDTRPENEQLFELPCARYREVPQ